MDSIFNFSVVIPVFNRARLVRQCLSCFTLPEACGLEVIVVDDGSTDNTAQIVKEVAAASMGATIKLIRQKNSGPGSARNAGAAQVNSPWIMFHDSDDVWFPWTLETLRNELATAEVERSDMVFLRMQRFSDPSELTSVSKAPMQIVQFPSMLDFRLNPPFYIYGSCNLFIRKESFQQLGGFSGSLRTSEDTDLLLRAGLLPTAAVTSPVLAGYRVGHAGTLSQQAHTSQLQILKRYRQGHYPGPSRKLTSAMALYVKRLTKQHFKRGNFASAYRLYLNGLPSLMAAGHWGDIVRLPLHPLLRRVSRRF